MSLVLKIILAVYVWSVATCFLVWSNRVRVITVTWSVHKDFWLYATNMPKPTIKTLPLFLVSMIPLANIGILLYVCTPEYEKKMEEILDNTLKDMAP